LTEEADEHLVGRGFAIGSPRDAARRGGHVLLTHPEARSISAALRRYEKVIGDYRAPDGLRLAPVPAYITREQVSEAVRRIARLVDSGRHRSVAPPATRVT
jgi:kynureninase